MLIKELLEKLHLLNLPDDKYVIVGSGALAIRGLRDAADLDILLSEELWDKLSNSYPIKTEGGFSSINLGDISLLGPGSLYRDPDISSITEMINSADLIEGFRFLNLGLLKKFKAKIGREKDLKDIETIQRYQQSKN